ncbi:hypothetical protein ACQ4LE_000237 [Meloidogyne hapla]
MPNGRITTRPLNRIYPLEVGIEPTDQINQPPEQENNPPETVRGEEVDKTRHEPVKSTLNLPPFEEEAEEDPPPFIEKQNKIVKEKIPHTRRVESKHGMATRSCRHSIGYFPCSHIISIFGLCFKYKVYWMS